MEDTASVVPEPSEAFHFEYSTVPGFFFQDQPDTDPDSFDFTKTNFGLIDQPYDADESILPSSITATSWKRFDHKLSKLNKHSDHNVAYKLLFLGRHGQGDHNVAEAFYGTKAWDCYYSTLPGNGTLTWTDAHLTDLGISQAQAVCAFWRSQIHSQKMPTPDLYYSSPLTRAIHTAQLTFSPVHDFLPPTKKFHCHILESLRECIGIHTCDQRSPRSIISHNFPEPIFTIHPPFPEDDTLWTADLRESPSAQTQRLRRSLDDIFSHDASSKSTRYLSITSHGGSILAILRAVKHRDFALPTGGVIPVLMKVERKEGQRPDEEVEPWLPREDCGDIHL